MYGPYSLKNLVDDDIRKSTPPKAGIYVWGVWLKESSQVIPLYVGKSRNIPKRIFEHLCAWRGGAYRIPAWSDIASPDKMRSPRIVHSPDSIKSFMEFLDNSEAQETVNNVIQNFFCCWMELDDYKNQSPATKESALANLFLDQHFLISHKKRNVNKDVFSDGFFEIFNKNRKN